MKRLIISTGLALVLLFSLCSVALAGSGEEVSVTCSDIVVVGDPWVGNTITASGTVTIIATATTTGNILTTGTAEADSTAYYEVTDPNGSPVASGGTLSPSVVSDSDTGWWKFAAEADASQEYNWSTDIYLNQAGDWTITQGGDASAEWARYLFGIWRTTHAEESDAATRSLTINAYIRTFDTGATLNLGSPQNIGQAFHQTFGNTWTWSEGGNTYVLYMPDGIEVTGYDGNELGNLYITITNGVVTFFPPWVQFSQPVTLYQVLNGELVELITFSQVESGQPVY